MLRQKKKRKKEQTCIEMLSHLHRKLGVASVQFDRELDRCLGVVQQVLGGHQHQRLLEGPVRLVSWLWVKTNGTILG